MHQSNNVPISSKIINRKLEMLRSAPPSRARGLGKARQAPTPLPRRLGSPLLSRGRALAILAYPVPFFSPCSPCRAHNQLPFVLTKAISQYLPPIPCLRAFFWCFLPSLPPCSPLAFPLSPLPVPFPPHPIVPPAPVPKHPPCAQTPVYDIM